MAVRLLHRARKQRPIRKAARTLRRYQRIGKGFLYPEKFIKFYDEMGDFVSEAKGKERKKLHELQTALSFTRMELARDHSFDAYGYAKRNGRIFNRFPKLVNGSPSSKSIKHLPEWDIIMSQLMRLTII